MGYIFHSYKLPNKQTNTLAVASHEQENRQNGIEAGE